MEKAQGMSALKTDDKPDNDRIKEYREYGSKKDACADGMDPDPGGE